jgi:hypothetical protein
MSSYLRQEYQRLQQKEQSGRYYFSGTPLTLGELGRPLPSGRREQYLLPAVPVNPDFQRNRFVPDATQPVVCVTDLARTAVFRALSHQALHTNLPEHQRRAGWRPENGATTHIATTALIENIRRLRQVGIMLLSTVVAVERTAVPFELLARNPHEFRSIVPVPFRSANICTVALDAWPDNVQEIEPWPADFDLSSYRPYEPHLADYLDELCAEESFNWAA